MKPASDSCAASRSAAAADVAAVAPGQRGWEFGRRRYSPSAVEEVGVIRFLREVGFTLAEITWGRHVCTVMSADSTTKQLYS